jgi:lysophospholipase L1-like esterase
MNDGKSNRYKNLFIVLLLGLLGVSILLNIVTYKELNKFYKGLYASLLDPIGLAYFQNDTISPESSKNIVVFYGDSRAAQWVSPNIEGFTFINRGIGNQTSAQVLLRFEEHIQPIQPDVIVLQVCINDLKTIPLFPEREDEIIAMCENNIEVIVQKARGLDSVVVLTTVFPTSGNVPLARRLVWSDEVYKAIDEVNVYILKYRADGVIVFDSASVLSNSEGNTKSEYVFDLLHLNASGYDALNLELAKILNDLK